MAAGGKRVSYIDPRLLQFIEESRKTSTGYYMYQYDKKNDGEPPSIEIEFEQSEENEESKESKEMQEVRKVIIMTSSILSLPRFIVSFSEKYRTGSRPAGAMDKICILFSKENIVGRDIINLDQKAKNTNIYSNIQKFIDLLATLKVCPDDLPDDFKRISTTGDGNCLFNAISYQLEGQETPQQVRQKIATSREMAFTDRKWGTEYEVINASDVYYRTVIWFTYLGGILRFHIVKKPNQMHPIVLFNCNLPEKNIQGNHWETIELSTERVQYIYLLYSLYMSVYDDEQPPEGFVFFKYKYEYNAVPQALFDIGIDNTKTLLYQKTPKITRIQNTDKDFDYFIYYDFKKPTPLFFFSNSVHCPHCFRISTDKYVCDACRRRMFVSTVSYFVDGLKLDHLTTSKYIDDNTRLFNPDFKTLCNRKSEPKNPSGELLFKDKKCSEPLSLFTRLENRYKYRYNVNFFGSDIAYIRDILLQLPKTWKKDDLTLQGLQSLKYANTPTDIWKHGKEPEMLYPTYPKNLVKNPFFELHLDKDDKPLFLYSNTELPLTPAFRKTKKSKSLKSLKKKKINKSKSLKKKKSKNLKSLKKLKKFN
jgi:hypothetical protein